MSFPIVADMDLSCILKPICKKLFAGLDDNQLRWAFTFSKTGAYYVQFRADMAQLEELDWNAINARYWQDCKEEKQAEFLVEHSFPWELVRALASTPRTPIVKSGTCWERLEITIRILR